MREEKQVGKRSKDQDNPVVSNAWELSKDNARTGEGPGTQKSIDKVIAQ